MLPNFTGKSFKASGASDIGCKEVFGAKYLVQEVLATCCLCQCWWKEVCSVPSGENRTAAQCKGLGRKAPSRTTGVALKRQLCR